MSRNLIIDKKKKNNISDKYWIIDKIGSGSFGEVYEVLCKNGETIAAKVEEKRPISRITLEYEIYKNIHNYTNAIGIPKIYNFIETPHFYTMYMQLLGPSLEDILNKYNRKLEIRTVLRLGSQIVSLLESIHSIGYIHRDIKPHNFLMGVDNNSSQVYITDFGLSRRYLIDGKHIPFNTDKSLIGTARYASINMHLGLEPSRRDDLESVGYMLVYLVKGTLPWQGMNKKGKTKKEYLEQIGNKKMYIDLNELCDGLPECFKEYIVYCKNLQFFQNPNYNYLKMLFTNEEQKFRTNIHPYPWVNNQPSILSL